MQSGIVVCLNAEETEFGAKLGPNSADPRNAVAVLLKGGSIWFETGKGGQFA